MNYSYDSFGWLSDSHIPGRTTGVEPPAHGPKTVGQPFPNWTGVEWVLATYSEPVTPPAPPTPKPALTHRTFLKRLTPQEFKAIRNAAKNDGDVDMFMYLFERSQDIRTDDQDTIDGVNMLVVKGILTAQRAEVILE